MNRNSLITIIFLITRDCITYKEEESLDPNPLPLPHHLRVFVMIYFVIIIAVACIETNRSSIKIFTRELKNKLPLNIFTFPDESNIFVFTISSIISENPEIC